MQSNVPHPSPSRAGSLTLVGGRLCVDFVNTTSGRHGPRCQEHLQRYSDLIAWAHHAGLLDAHGAAILERAAAADPHAAVLVLKAALQLREWIHDLLLSQLEGKPPPEGALSGLNQVLAEGMGRARLRADLGGFVWDWPQPSGEAAEQLAYPLWAIARSAAELLQSPMLGRLRQCPGEHCGWLFLDMTKNGSRRWCEMQVCGSRAKMQRHRQRRHPAPAG